MNILDWVEINNIQDQQDWTKAELVLIGKLTDPNHNCFDGLTFDKEVYHAMAAAFLPNRFEIEWDSDEKDFETVYVQYIKNGEQPPEINHEETNPCILAHHIFFHTNFGENRITDPSLVDKINKSIEWLMSVDATEEQVNDLLAELLIALYCLNIDMVNSEHYNNLRTWYDSNIHDISWTTYHPFVVCNILFALMDSD